MKRLTITCLAAVVATLALWSAAPAQDPKPIKLLIITGDHGHDWKATTAYFKEFLPKDRINVDVTETAGKDLTPDNLKKYDALLLNYRDTPKGAKESPDTVWSPENKQAFLGAVRGGKGLVVYHHTSAAFLEWLEFERAIAGGWRGQGYHGPKHKFEVKITQADHPITRGLPKKFAHELDELYANSVMFPENVVLATAYSDPNKPEGTGLDEPMIWVKHYGKGRVFVNAMGHDVEAMKGVGFQTLMVRGIEWAATGSVTSAVPAKLVASTPAAAPKEQSNAPGWGTIKGRVVLAGTTSPTPKLLVPQGNANVKDATCCAAENIFSEELVVNKETRGVRWVIAHLNRPSAIHPDLARAAGEVELGVRGCSKQPHVLVMRQGQPLKISNSDPVAHNTLLSPWRGDAFNTILPAAAAAGKSTIEAPRLLAQPRPFTVKCNIHPWETAHIGVFDHPYFAVTDENGAFEIRQVPTGKVNLVLWQESIGYAAGGRDGQEVEVKSGWVSALGDIEITRPK